MVSFSEDVQLAKEEEMEVKKFRDKTRRTKDKPQYTPKAEETHPLQCTSRVYADKHQ